MKFNYLGCNIAVYISTHNSSFKEDVEIYSKLRSLCEEIAKNPDIKITLTNNPVYDEIKECFSSFMEEGD